MSKIIDRIVSGSDEYLIQDHRLEDGEIVITGGKVDPGYGLTLIDDKISINHSGCSAKEDQYALAIGHSALATGLFAFAHGGKTSAYGYASHAEGWETLAADSYSHAEGYDTSALLGWSHAEGFGTVAGYGSHAEGHYTSAGGSYSHAEGYYTSAKADHSHAEGYVTVAGYNYETVVGKWNLTARGDSPLFVVGNGTKDKRSDAFIVLENGVVSAKTIVAETPIYTPPATTGVGLSGDNEYTTITETEDTVTITITPKLKSLLETLSSVFFNDDIPFGEHTLKVNNVQGQGINFYWD